jgi:hypothetical protein
MKKPFKNPRYLSFIKRENSNLSFFERGTKGDFVQIYAHHEYKRAKIKEPHLICLWPSPFGIGIANPLLANPQNVFFYSEIKLLGQNFKAVLNHKV